MGIRQCGSVLFLKDCEIIVFPVISKRQEKGNYLGRNLKGLCSSGHSQMMAKDPGRVITGKSKITNGTEGHLPDNLQIVICKIWKLLCFGLHQLNRLFNPAFLNLMLSRYVEL